MPTLAIVLVLIAAVFHALRDITTKQSKEKLLFVWWMSLISLGMLAPISIYFWVKTQPSLNELGFALGMGLIHATYWRSYAKAYEKGDLSHVYPIIHSAPAFVLLFGVVFLHERPSLLGVAGILLITAGLYFINLKKLTPKSLLEPVLSVFKEEPTRLAFFALIFVTAYSLLDKVAVTELHPMVYVFVMSISALLIFSFYIRKQIQRAWLKPMQEEKGKVLAAALFASINYPLTLFALQLTNASYVSAFRQVSVVVAVFISMFLLKEHCSRFRLLSALLIFFGAVLIAL